jgi:hypothetical protein
VSAVPIDLAPTYAVTLALSGVGGSVTVTQDDEVKLDLQPILRGPKGDPGAGVYVHAFSWGDATPATVLTSPAGKTVLTVQIAIVTPFDGDAPTVQVGDADDPGRLLSSAQIDPKERAIYEVSPAWKYDASTQIWLSLSPDGSGAGAGVLTITTDIS